MAELTLKIEDYAHGGATIGRDKQGRPVFVPYAIPGETVRVAVAQDKGRYAHAELLEVLDPAASRVPPRCPHFTTCSVCAYQHIAYEAQLQAKQAVARDQLQRLGGIRSPRVLPVQPHPAPYGYAFETNLSPTAEGGLGYWSSRLRQVIPIATCPILAPPLLDLFQDIELDLPELRKLTLRLGYDGSVLAALEVEDVEPPELETDFPVSVAIVLPDRMAASLIGDPYLVHEVKGRLFRVSPGCFFHPSPVMAGLLVDAVLRYAALSGRETLLEAYSGVGLLTAFLAAEAAQVLAIEVNEDAAADMVANLEQVDNVTLYQGLAEEILPLLDVRPEVLVVDPGRDGLPAPVMRAVAKLAPSRLVYISSELSSLARDAKGLVRAGFELVEVQPVDMRPQTSQIDTVSWWRRR